MITKSADDKVDEALDLFDASKATNKRKRNFGEIVPHRNMTDNNPNLTRIGNDPPTGLDDKIKKGIDGIYENADPPPKFVIDEAKYGKSKLSKTKDGKQMSDDWIKGNKRLEEQVGKKKAKEIIQPLDNGEVDKVLSKIDEAGNVVTKKLDSAGNVIGNWP